MTADELRAVSNALTNDAIVDAWFRYEGEVHNWIGSSRKTGSRWTMEWTTHPGKEPADAVFTTPFPGSQVEWFKVTLRVTREGVAQRLSFSRGFIPSSAAPSRGGSSACVEDAVDRMNSLHDVLDEAAAASSRERQSAVDFPRLLARLDALERLVLSAPSAADMDVVSGLLGKIEDRLEHLDSAFASMVGTLERVTLTVAGLQAPSPTQSTPPPPIANPTPLVTPSASFVLHDVGSWPSPLDDIQSRLILDQLHSDVVRPIADRQLRAQANESFTQLKDFVNEQRSLHPGWRDNSAVIQRANRLIFMIKAFRSQADGRAMAVDVIKTYDAKFPSASGEADPFFALAEAQAPTPAAKRGGQRAERADPKPTGKKGGGPAAAE